MDELISDEELVTRFPGHTLTRDNAAHYRGRLAHRLVINRCGDCGTWRHPPKPVCPACWSWNIVPTEVSGQGSIFMTVFLHQGPPAEGVDYATPHPVVTVALDEQEGLRFTSTVVGAAGDAIRIAERVELDWIERSGTPLPVFRLASTTAGSSAAGTSTSAAVTEAGR
ncbi:MULTISPECIES: Zn-ribbon domain-containing OB-fold protein [unclassified Frankia]|uniref:Zn-ribbon domain-containing OB-fold protein n=1 Tax=unclassified Frankia TaxID=2632575 RepID=UPI002AD57BDC|nr:MULTISPECIES: zinc ribbon domain-containing protein [unclassified Frankia]